MSNTLALQAAVQDLTAIIGRVAVIERTLSSTRGSDAAFAAALVSRALRSADAARADLAAALIAGTDPVVTIEPRTTDGRFSTPWDGGLNL